MMHQWSRHALRTAQKSLERLTAEKRSNLLKTLASEIENAASSLLLANAKDMEQARIQETSAPLLDRLLLTPERIKTMVQGVREVATLEDPLGKILEERTRPNGLQIKKVSVPLGVLGVIYEARPNVTLDVAALALRTGNAAILRGSRSAHTTNQALIAVIQEVCRSHHLPSELVTQYTEYSEEGTQYFLSSNSPAEVLIPRGGGALIKFVRENARIPVIETGEGNCHLFIDDTAPYTRACEIALNAKTSRPSVCNAIETLLIHEAWPTNSTTDLLQTLREKGVELRGCRKTQELLPSVTLASQEDYRTEYNALVLAVKIVSSLEEALTHIAEFSTQHSEAIVTDTPSHADQFLREVDAAAVYVNASTRFTDGGEFGFGAEVGISTQKLHARGPMGLEALTSYKYLVVGNGQIR